MHWDICVFERVPVPQNCIYISFLAQVRTLASGTSYATLKCEIVGMTLILINTLDEVSLNTNLYLV